LTQQSTPAGVYVNDMVRVKLNGVVQENVFYYVSAELVEDFSSLSKEDLENAPVFKLASTTVDLGKIPGSAPKDVEFRIHKCREKRSDHKACKIDLWLYGSTAG